jgi:hypothetical protein
MAEGRLGGVGEPIEASRLGRVGKPIEAIWGIVSKGGLLALVAIVLVVGVAEVVRECLTETVLLEPVVVKGPVGDGGPTVEMATQQIVTYIDKIQRSGEREWRPHAFAENEQTISIQIPGSSLTVDSIVREIADLFPHRRRVLKVSITASPSGKGYVGAVTVSGSRSPKRKVCETDMQPGGLGKMFECIAFEATRAVDPLFAASYALSVEEERCARFAPEQLAPTDPVGDMKRLLQVLRDYCSFSLTRNTVSTIISRYRKDDQPWVSYMYGKLHLARADAVAKVDPEAQWFEFDRAVNRFDEFSHKELPPSAKAFLMEAYIKNFASIHDSVNSLNGNFDEDLIRYRLSKVEKVLSDATDQPEIRVKQPQPQPQQAQTLWQAVTAGVEPPWLYADGRLAAMLSHTRGLTLYRQWMIDTRSRYQHGEFRFAVGDDELARLRDAEGHFEAVKRQARLPFKFFIEWGDALLALGSFDRAVEQYRRAGDIAPKSSTPSLNVVVALLEKSKVSRKTEDLFEALRHTSNYLTWISEGGPFSSLVDVIAEALRKVVDGSVAEDFAFCRWGLSVHESDPRLPDLSHTAALKYCVDRARDSLVQRVVKEAGMQEVANQK